MNGAHWGALWSEMLTHVWAVALCCGRLLPVAFLCPVLGGSLAPTAVKLGLVLSLGVSIHLSGAVLMSGSHPSSWQLLTWVARELAFGTTLGLVAALPFDAARTGGRIVDLVRGSSAEASLPVSGTRESATGDGLYQLLVSLAVTGVAFPLLLSSLWRSFAWVKLGAYVPTESVTLQVATLAGASLATGLAISVPVVGLALAVDIAIGFGSRFAPQVGLQELNAPLKILGGGAVIFGALGLFAHRLLGGAEAVEATFRLLFGAGR